MNAKQRAIALADQLLSEEGRFKNINSAHASYVFSPDDYSEGEATEHMQRKIYALQSDPELKRLIESFSLPLFDAKYEKMILELLNAKEITHRHLILAVLSAFLCPLRQRVGSCFATAPAIIVHEEQPRQFLRDLKDLLYTGKLTRVMVGVEYTVPISPTAGPTSGLASGPASGPGELGDEHLFLKVWEYSIASFVDVKTEFSRWNLYESLGLHHGEKGGIGELMYSYLEQSLAQTNDDLSKTQQDYEIAFDQVRSVEARLKNAATESEIRRLKTEHQARSYHFSALENQRSALSEKSHHIANFFSFLIDQFIERFQEQFQEIYDARMQEILPNAYDDAPAGFRLLYKHGRTHVGSWTFIYNAEEYVQALKEFFRSIEHPMQEACEWSQGKEEISHFITRIIHHVATEEFLTSSFYRMAKAHKVPMQNIPLEQMEKKPWAYTSGGTLTTLLKTYFKREGSFSSEARWVESPQDLLIFLLDTLKTLAPKVTDPFGKDPKKRMLMTSPTHVFSLLPGHDLFKRGWEDPGFTYTWVRDKILKPRRAFYSAITLAPHEQHLLLEELDITQRTQIPLTLSEFRSSLPQDPNIDAKLFELLPLITPAQADELYLAFDLKARPPSKPLFRRHLHDEILSHYEIANEDMHEKVARLMEERNLAPPRPLIFADTNWPTFYFSFVVNPASGVIELWRTDKIGLTGAPMSDWGPYLDGTSKHPWRLFLRPHEYVSPL